MFLEKALSVMAAYIFNFLVEWMDLKAGIAVSMKSVFSQSLELYISETIEKGLLEI